MDYEAIGVGPKISARLAKLEATIIDSKAPGDFERRIVWNLFGEISFSARQSQSPRTAAKARWLLALMEDSVRRTVESKALGAAQSPISSLPSSNQAVAA